MNALSIISGAFGVFRKELLLQLGGYRRTVGEDIDITLRFQQYLIDHPEKKILFLPDAICYTECPESWRDLYKQRVRWQKAFINCVNKYSGFLMKTFLIRSLSFFFLIDSFLTGTIGSIVTVITFLLLLMFPSDALWTMVIAYGLSSLTIYFLYSVIGIFISYGYGVRMKGRNIWRLFGIFILDILFFRLITLWCVVVGTFLYFFNQEDWNKVARTGRKYKTNQMM